MNDLLLKSVFIFLLGWKVKSLLVLVFGGKKRENKGSEMVKVLNRIRIQGSKYHETSQQEVESWHEQNVE